MALPVLTTTDILERFLSSQGIASFSDDDSQTVDDCISYAAGLILGKLAAKYVLSVLAGALLLTEWATVISARTLCTRRGNPIPESLELLYQGIIGDGGFLSEVVKGTTKLVDADGNIIAGKGSFAPTMSNLRIDRRYPNEQVRVVEQTSTNVQTTLERDSAFAAGVYDG